MTKTPAQRQREYMQRKKQEKAKANLATAASDIFRRPFFEAWSNELQGHANDFAYYFDEMGLAAPDYENDSGPEAFSQDVFPPEMLHEIFPDLSHGSLRRADMMIGSLVEAASSLAAAVGQYKRNEIKARLAEIEAADLSDPETKRAALKDAARLNKMLEQLDKQVRLTFPQWKVTG